MSDSVLIGRRIRPQARPIDWSKLNLSQREAFRRILYMIDEAITTYDSRHDLQGRHLVQPNRASNNVFISGSRGTGKTSVLLTLMNLRESETQSESKIQKPKGSDRMKAAMERLKERVVWLEPIDMDPLPEPFNLVTTILERIHQGIEFETARRRNFGRTTSNIEEYGFSTSKLNTEEEFRRLYTSATLAWNSNINERRNQEPDYYSLELSRTNKARLSLNQRISEFLFEETKDKQLGIDSPLFIVTIDDFDMHPTAALRVLKLLRMITVQRIFFLMLGDMSMLELMADLSVSREICGLIPSDINNESLGFHPSQVGQAIGSISRTTLRKVLPPQQRVFINEPSLAEGMRFRPSIAKANSISGDSKANVVPTLLSLMGNTPSSVFSFHQGLDPKECLGGFPVVSLMGYLLNEGLPLKEYLPVENAESFRPTDFKLVWAREKGIECPKTRAKYFGGFKYFLNETESPKNTGPIFENAIQGIKLAIGDDSKPDVGRQIDQSVKSNYFWGNEIFRASPRVLADLWFLFRKHADRVTREFEPRARIYEKLGDEFDPAVRQTFGRLEVELIEDFAQFCRNRLLEEPVFTSEQRDDISFCLTPFSYGDFNWSRMPLKLIAVTEPATTIPASDWARNRTKAPLLDDHEFKVRNFYHEVHFSKVRDWSIVQKDIKDEEKATAGTEQFSKGDATKEVSKSSAASLMILHDMLELGGRTHQFESSLLPADDGTLTTLSRVDPENETNQFLKETKEAVWCRWAHVRYKGSFKNYADLHWPPPTVLSFWGLDIFRRHWNATIEKSENPALRERERLELLAYGWIAGGCAVIEGKNLDLDFESRSGKTVPDYSDWSKLGVRLGGIAKDYFQNLHHRQVDQARRTRSWLANVVAMMMPESGLPTRLLFQFLFSIDVGVRDDKNTGRSAPLPEIPPGADGLLVYQERNRKELEFVSNGIRRACHKMLHFVTSASTARGKCEDTLASRTIRGLMNVWLDPRITNSEMKSSTFQEPLDKVDSFESYFKNKSKSFIKKGRAPTKDLHFKEEFTSEIERSDIKLKWFNDNFCKWIRGFYIVRFMEEHKAEIRARRGVRLSLLQRIGEGSFTERMLRYHSLNLANRKNHSELMAKSGRPNTIKIEYGEIGSSEPLDDSKKFQIEDVWLLGQIFEGGGLVPHEDEVPGLGRLRAKWKQNSKTSKCAQTILSAPKESWLDEIGISQKLKRDLLAHFGSIQKLALAETKQLREVSGVGEKRAREIYNGLQALQALSINFAENGE